MRWYHLSLQGQLVLVVRVPQCKLGSHWDALTTTLRTDFLQPGSRGGVVISGLYIAEGKFVKEPIGGRALWRRGSVLGP